MKKSLLLIMEEDLANRFSFFEHETGISTHVLKLKTSLKQSKISTVLSRLAYKKQLNAEYDRLKPKLAGLDQIFISNPEGFIAKNIIAAIRKDFPDKLISLQHGIFLLRKDSFLTKNLKRFTNFLSNILLGYYIVGDGFGDKSTDKYIVYNSLYKKFLLENNWNDSDVIVSSYLLKGEKEVEKVYTGHKRNAVFFLQCLHKLGITDENTETEMISTVVRKLSVRFDNVLIKQHPYAYVELPSLPSNAVVIETLPDFKEISFGVAAFSTALLELEKYGVPYTAIISCRLKVKKEIYKQFLNIHDFDKVSEEFLITANQERLGLPCFFEIGETQWKNI